MLMFIDTMSIQSPYFLKNWFDLKSLAVLDCAYTNVSLRNVWLELLRNIRSGHELRTLLRTTKLKTKSKDLFLKWLINREIFNDINFLKSHKAGDFFLLKSDDNYYKRSITSLQSEIHNANDESNEVYNTEFQQNLEEEHVDVDDDFASYCFQTGDDIPDRLCDQFFKDEQITAELLKRSLRNLHSELLYLVTSATKIAGKFETCIEELSSSDSMKQSMIASRMCSYAVEANQMAITAAGRFSNFTNKLLLSNFNGEQQPEITHLVSSSSSFSTTYVGLGITDKWSIEEDNYLIKLYKSYVNQKVDNLSLTAEINVR